MRAIGSIYLLLALVSLAGCKSEIEACNSEEVKNTILSGSFGKVKNAALQSWSKGQNDFSKRAVISLQRWRGEVVNIRQTKYDEVNNTRYCMADFNYQNQLSQEMLTLLVVDPLVMPTLSATCVKAFSYKIEPLLDKPKQFYVSWRCES